MEVGVDVVRALWVSIISNDEGCWGWVESERPPIMF